MDGGSITRWFNSLQGGNRAAAEQLWQRFGRRLIGLARLRLRTAARRAADEEDAVLSAFDSFCRAAEEGRFLDVNDRGGLWSLLVSLTVCKVADQVRHETRLKRGGGANLCETDFEAREEGLLLDKLIGGEPSPGMIAEMTEQAERLLDSLHDPVLRSIALWKMEGYGNEEIASKLDCARSTVQRKLDLIKARWQQELS